MVGGFPIGDLTSLLAESGLVTFETLWCVSDGHCKDRTSKAREIVRRETDSGWTTAQGRPDQGKGDGTRKYRLYRMYRTKEEKTAQDNAWKAGHSKRGQHDSRKGRTNNSKEDKTEQLKVENNRQPKRKLHKTRQTGWHKGRENSAGFTRWDKTKQKERETHKSKNPRP